MAEWKLIEPGVLALVGTDFRIVHKPGQWGDFSVYCGDRLIQATLTLSYAKGTAEGKQAELVEMGIA